jgi:hypothetical protein
VNVFAPREDVFKAIQPAQAAHEASTTPCNYYHDSNGKPAASRHIEIEYQCDKRQANDDGAYEQPHHQEAMSVERTAIELSR